MLLCAIHIIAAGATSLLLGFLVYLNVEQVKEYDYLRKEIDEKLAELTCKPKNSEEFIADRMHFTRIVKDVVGECVLEVMRDVNEYLMNGRLRQLNVDDCAQDCDCKPLCAPYVKNETNSNSTQDALPKTKLRVRFNGVQTKLITENDAHECEKCRFDCNKKLLSDVGTIGRPNCRYSRTHVNYADSQLGARVVMVDSRPFDSTGLFSWVLPSNYGKNPPEHMLSPNIEPGNCFAFKGVARVTIKLSKPILVEIIEIAHIERCRSPNRDTSSAPKDFTVYGIEKHNGEEILLGDFAYKNSAPSELFNCAAVRTELQLIRIFFKTNHGNSLYTCVYKVGVYGREL